jgi:hypothetical protein
VPPQSQGVGVGVGRVECGDMSPLWVHRGSGEGTGVVIRG